VQTIIPLDYGAGLTLTSAKYYTPSGRLIQRDYADSSFYDYYTHGGSRRFDQKDGDIKPAGPERKTDLGRPVYGGGGIAPDESVKAKPITDAQRRLLSPLFAFARELVNGRVAALSNYRVPGEINFGHEFQPGDFSISEAAFTSFKDFVAADPTFKMVLPLVDHNRSFVETQLRFNILTAAYGRVMADRLTVITDDPQVARAVTVVPRARDLAMSASKHQVQPQP
jgi:carboxyl-terminal processing protease